jgi:hypothetical protein
MRAEVPGFHRATLVYGESGGDFHFVPLRLQAVNYRYLLQGKYRGGSQTFSLQEGTAITYPDYA